MVVYVFCDLLLLFNNILRDSCILYMLTEFFLLLCSIPSYDSSVSNIFIHSSVDGHLRINFFFFASLVAQRVKNPPAMRVWSHWVQLGFDRWVGTIPWRRERLPTPVSWPGEFHGQRSLAGYSPWGCKELDTTEWLSVSFFCYFKPYCILAFMCSHLPVQRFSRAHTKTVMWPYWFTTAVTPQPHHPLLLFYFLMFCAFTYYKWGWESFHMIKGLLLFNLLWNVLFKFFIHFLCFGG